MTDKIKTLKWISLTILILISALIIAILFSHNSYTIYNPFNHEEETQEPINETELKPSIQCNDGDIIYINGDKAMCSGNYLWAPTISTNYQPGNNVKIFAWLEDSDLNKEFNIGDSYNYDCSELIANNISLTPYSACRVCEDLVYMGFDDWHLAEMDEPSMSTLDTFEDVSEPWKSFLRNAYDINGQKDNMWSAACNSYWTGNSFSNNEAWYVRMPNTQQQFSISTTSKYGNNCVYCIREIN